MVGLDPFQVAYLAGLVDGEGSLECQKDAQLRGATMGYRLRLSFCFATPEPLATISQWLGIRVNTYPATDPTRSPRYRMHITKGTAVPLIERMLPYLILKKREASLILAIEHVRAANCPGRRTPRGIARRMPLSAVAEMDALWLQLRSLKSNKRRMSARVNLAA